MVGLWKAKKRFGPDAGGPLIIERTGVDYIAVPELHLVLASFSGSYATGAYRRFSDELIPQHILPAVREGTTTKARP